MDIGKYAGLEQIGRRSWYENGSSWQVSFMSLEYFQNYARLNGLPERGGRHHRVVRHGADQTINGITI